MPSNLAIAYQRRHALLALNAARRVGRAWGASEDEFVRIAAAIDAGAHAQAVALADAYMAAVTGGVALGVDPSTVGRQVDRDELWQRPSKHARMAGSTAAGLAFAQQLAKTNVLMAARDTWHRWTSTNPNIAGYKRVLGGGGASGRNCGLCLVASTQRYHREQLHPIHGNCSCTVEPIMGKADPGLILDKQRLDFAVENADDYTREALSRAKFAPEDLPVVAVRQHGELGPTLTDARHKFTGPEDLAA